MTLKDLLAVIDSDAEVLVWTKSGKQFEVWSGMNNPPEEYLTAKVINLSAETEALRLYFYVDIDAE